MPLLLEAPLSVADVQPPVANDPRVSASNTKAADRIRDAFMATLLWNVRLWLASAPSGQPRNCGAAMHNLTQAQCGLFPVTVPILLFAPSAREMPGKCLPDAAQMFAAMRKKPPYPSAFVTQRYRHNLSDASALTSRYSGRSSAAGSLRPTRGRIAANHRLSNLNCPWHPQNRTRKTIS